MKTRPAVTIILVILSIVMTLIAPAFDSSIYGVDGDPLQWWSFKPTEPFRQYGLTLLLTPFLHLNVEHLIVNMIMLTPVALMIERKLGAKYLIRSFLGIHGLAILLIALAAQLIKLDQSSFLGMSHVIVGLYANWAILNKKLSLFVFALGVLIVGFWQNQNPLTILAHGLGIVSGIILFGFGHFRHK